MKCEASKILKMRAFISGGAGFIGSHLLTGLFFRKNVEGVVAFQFTSRERAEGKAVTAIRFHCSNIKALCWRSWRISGDAIKAMLEEISYA